MTTDIDGGLGTVLYRYRYVVGSELVAAARRARRAARVGTTGSYYYTAVDLLQIYTSLDLYSRSTI